MTIFSIIMPVYDPHDKFVEAGVIQEALRKVRLLEGDFELIVVNNNSNQACPRLARYLRSLGADVKLVELDGNRGTSGGFNAGMLAASLDSIYLVFMSTDGDIVDFSMLHKIHAAMALNPDVAIAHPTSVYEDNNEYNYSLKYCNRFFYWHIKRGRTGCIAKLELEKILSDVSRHTGIDRPIASFPLTFAIIRRELIASIGSFDEGVKWGCHENNDLSYRAMLKGFRVGRLKGVFINHERFLFHSLTAAPGKEKTMPHSEVISQATEWWNAKWGRSYEELYARWRWGPIISKAFLPYFGLKKSLRFLQSGKWA